MITVYFVRNGNKIPVEVEEGSTLMEAAKFYSNGTVDEITADCGGACACGTCHVYIEEPWKSILGPIDTDTPEIDLLILFDKTIYSNLLYSLLHILTNQSLVYLYL